MTKNKYCCFFCPENDYSEKSLDDTCPKCGRAYGFPLEHLPKAIGDYRIIKELGRGFYGATYISESGPFNRPCVVKISPKSFYTFFKKKDFYEESKIHARVAANADHIVNIQNVFDETIIFSDTNKTKLECHVSVLDYVDGNLLKDYLEGTQPVSARIACQIAIDLINIRKEFSSNQLNHNDLKADNLIVERLAAAARRSNAIDDSIKVKAIDLGSIADESKSSDNRKGDLYFIATHIDALLDQILNIPSQLNDRDYRISLELQGITHGLLADPQNIRLPNSDDLIALIIDSYSRASQPWRPWTQPLNLRGFSDHYNAQTLPSWYVPGLLVDPDDRWFVEFTKPGPQIITGMRGCGKTMLLRALDFHARATSKDGETFEDVLNRIRNDRFIGLFASAQRLLDLKQQSLYKLEHRLARLFVSYALEAARVLIHLKDIDSSALVVNAHVKLASAIADYLEGSDELRLSLSLDDLSRRLESILVLTLNDMNRYTVRIAPIEAFTHLAKSLCECSGIFQSSTVFFLLDDVSTRYHPLDRIEELLSALLFQTTTCAFKFTSEWQTIELGLKSPGRTHPIRIGRDLSVFDLGADVLEKVTSRGNGGKRFILDILEKRTAAQTGSLIYSSPKDVLGDVTLEQVAREIASSSETSAQRKNVYRGLSCITNVCVGDVGDVIKLYEEIIRHASLPSKLPIAKELQSMCFRELSSLRIFDLNRRKGYFKDHALGFADAAHYLLVRSYKEKEGVKEGEKHPRLRQYSLIYVRVTTDDEKKRAQQIDRLRELIDASVFVYSGGAPRTKTKDSNPIQQFILSYRKIYGLSSFIGLANRDRFELSGEDLDAWLENPSEAKEILLRNQIKEEIGSNAESSAEESDEDEINTEAVIFTRDVRLVQKNVQPNLFDYSKEKTPDSSNTRLSAKPVDINIEKVEPERLQELKVETVFTSLGFEDRALASNKYLAKVTNPDSLFAVRYSLKGKADEIINTWAHHRCKIHEFLNGEAGFSPPEFPGLTLIDVSGLSKPFIFKTVLRELNTKGRVLICHATAEKYYPLEDAYFTPNRPVISE